jgi:hypothetical protein
MIVLRPHFADFTQPILEREPVERFETKAGEDLDAAFKLQIDFLEVLGAVVN